VAKSSKQIKIDVHPTNGCITVKGATSVDDAFNRIKNILNAHPDIDCDWITGIVIPKEST
jgi:hypothetical protein